MKSGNSGARQSSSRPPDQPRRVRAVQAARRPRGLFGVIGRGAADKLGYFKAENIEAKTSKFNSSALSLPLAQAGA